jgi:hydroxymethylpyrimidine/phosphomethylpyrimidine kinase
MRKPKSFSIALTIAGSDSGGGAGIQADLKTFAALGVHGVCAVTCLTAQNPRRVRGIQPCTPEFLRLQLGAVFDGLRPAAAKTGMLYSAALIRAVAAFLLSQPRLPLVVDPVMVSTSGTPLLDPKAVDVLCAELLPLAALVTPNLPEAEVLTGRRLRSAEDLRAAAKDLHRRFGCPALVKGGHLRGYQEAVDIFYDGRQELLLSAGFINAGRTHGTGCTYSAAITGHLARGCLLPEAVRRAKENITQAIARSRRAGRYEVLDGFGEARATSF